MTAKVHRHFVKTARGVSSPLHAAIRDIGRIRMPDRRRPGLAYFLSRVVVGQQLSTAAARSIWTRVEAAVKANGSTVPEFFRGTNARLLRRCGLSKNKVRALIAIREAHETGALSMRRLQRMDHAERSEHLVAIWGIGQWTADMASIFFFNDPDVWPEGDLAVQKTFRALCGTRSRTKVLKMARSFAPYRSYLALYMWRHLDAPSEAAKKRATKQPV